MTGASAWLAVRSLFWTFLMPGTVAGYVPWRYFGLRDARFDPTRPAHLISLPFLAIGAGLLTVCIVEFARRGRGTLSPADPPRELVVAGPYRYVRNPMYLAVACLLIGEILLTGSRDLLWYAAIGAVVVNVFVIGYEEPKLRDLFGASYEAYARRVGRWLPSLRRR